MADSPEEEYALERDAAEYSADMRLLRDVAERRALAVAKNVATNGRLFCIMLAAAVIAGGHPALAILAALPVGASCLVDQITVPSTRALMSTLVYGFAASLAIVSFLLLCW